MIEELKTQIQAETSSSPVHVYMKGTPHLPMCGFSKTTCDVFNALGVQFSATNVLDDLDGYRAALSEITNWPTIPQVFINGEFVGGCDIVVEMYRSGDLQKMLETSPAPASQEAGP